MATSYQIRNCLANLTLSTLRLVQDGGTRQHPRKPCATATASLAQTDRLLFLGMSALICGTVTIRMARARTRLQLYKASLSETWQPLRTTPNANVNTAFPKPWSERWKTSFRACLYMASKAEEATQPIAYPQGCRTRLTRT